MTLATDYSDELILFGSGYNPTERRTSCARSCGNISIPFPFGLEEGCFARKEFFLNCTNISYVTLGDTVQVTNININEGFIQYRSIYTVEISDSEGPELYADSGESSSMQWAVANLTCSEAQQNTSGYACVSTNSICIPVNITQDFTYNIGYRCKCLDGFQGNPYVRNGCTGSLSLSLSLPIDFQILLIDSCVLKYRNYNFFKDMHHNLQPLFHQLSGLIYYLKKG